MAKNRLRANRISFYVNDYELNLLKQNSKSCNLSVSEFLRRGIIYKAEIDDLQKKEKTLIENFKALKQIGVNLNQLTKSLNKLSVNTQDKKSGGFFSKLITNITDMGVEKKIMEVVEDISSTLKKIKGRE